MLLEEVRPEAHGATDDIEEPDRLAAEYLYFKTRNVKVAAEVLAAEVTPVMTGLLDTNHRLCDLCVFRFVANILQVGEFRADASDVILEFLQGWKRRIRTKCLGYVITKMPGFASAVPRQILIEVVVFEPLHVGLQCFKRRRCVKAE